MAETGPLSAAESERLEAVPLPLRERQHLRLLALADDPRFSALLVDQLIAAGIQIEDLAMDLGVSPLELSLDQLIDGTTATAPRGPGSMGPPEP